jgi:penicillin amidase
MANAWLPVAGWTGEHEWKGSIPFDKLSRMRNPAPGFIVTANNRIADKDFPYYIALNYVPEYRARRLYERLKDKTDATVEDMKSVHADRLSIPGRAFAELLFGTHPISGLSEKAKSILEGWDGVMDKDAVAPTIVSAFRIKLLRKIIPHLAGPLADEMFTSTGRGAPRHLNELASLLVKMSRSNDTELLPQGSNWQKVAAEALAEATAYLEERLGPDIHDWRWGRVHRTQPKHPLSDVYPEAASLLDPKDVAMGGDGDTPQAAGYSPGNPFGVTLLSVARYAYDTADWDNSGWAVPLGVSGHPGSPHYADQTSVWADVDLIPMYYTWDLVKANAESHQVIEPS